MPTSTRLPEPVTVGVSLEEAEREVLSWFDPGRPARMEWSKFIQRSDLESLPPDSLWDCCRAYRSSEMKVTSAPRIASGSRAVKMPTSPDVTRPVPRVGA